MGCCTDSQLYEERIRRFPKERWARLGKAARKLFGDRPSPRNWDGFTKTPTPRAYSSTHRRHHDSRVWPGRIFKLAAQSRCPESINAEHLYRDGCWIESMLAGFTTIENLGPPEHGCSMSSSSQAEPRHSEHLMGLNTVAPRRWGSPSTRRPQQFHDSGCPTPVGICR